MFVVIPKNYDEELADLRNQYIGRLATVVFREGYTKTGKI
jgi:hypothetical protein